MSDFYYLNEDKTYRKADIWEWSEQFKELLFNDQRHVGNDYVCGKYVSTVWLGIDHIWSDGKPLLFETMVFDTPHNGNEIYKASYTSWDEAFTGHQKAIEWVKDNYKECAHEELRVAGDKGLLE